MNLHVFFDGLGFYAKETVERIERVDPGNNTYINFADAPKHRHERVTTLAFSTQEVGRLANDAEGLQRIYFHFFGPRATYIMRAFRKKQPRLLAVWVFWSAEFYNLDKFLPELYGPFSRKYLPANGGLHKLKRAGSLLKSRLMGRAHYPHRSFIASMRELDYFACLLDHDYLNVVNYSRSKMRHARFAYLSYEQIIGPELLHDRTSGNKIMVNHSADPALNHYEVLAVLKEKKINNRIYMPVAYGEAQYKQDIVSIAREWFGDRAEIQEDFLQKDAYTARLKEIGFAIFNINVQQGLGNILVLLWLGVKLFLKKNNPVYIDLRDWGMHIYSVEDDLPLEDFSTGLDEEKLMKNRQILKDKLSNGQVDTYYRNVLHLPI